MSSESHNYAISVEWIVRDVFHCERFGFGGIANSDFIERAGGMYTAMACSLATIYNHASAGHRKQIEDFLNGYSYYNDKSIVDIINENGKEEVEKIIEEFKNLVK